jgi:hypothetical protein
MTLADNCLIRLTLLSQLLYDFLGLADGVALEVKLGSQIVDQGFQVTVLVHLLVHLEEQVLFNELEGLLAFLLADELVIELVNVPLQLVFVFFAHWGSLVDILVACDGALVDYGLDLLGIHCWWSIC